MFPQLGAPIGFILSAGTFLILGEVMSEEAFFAWGWRVPFIASVLLVIVGLYVRLKITETPEFQKAIDKHERVEVPVAAIFRSHKRSLVLGTFVALATFVLFYLMTVFSLSWGTTKLGYSREQFLLVQMTGVVFFGLMIPVSGILSDRFGRRLVLVLTTIGIGVFGLFMEPLLSSGLGGAFVFSIVGLGLMGLTYGPIGAALAAPFPTAVRYTGASMTFNLAASSGASLAPYIATWLATNYSLGHVGYYLLAAASITLVCLLSFERGRGLGLRDGIIRKKGPRRISARPFFLVPISGSGRCAAEEFPDFIARHEIADPLDFPFQLDAGMLHHRCAHGLALDIRAS